MGGGAALTGWYTLVWKFTCARRQHSQLMATLADYMFGALLRLTRLGAQGNQDLTVSQLVGLQPLHNQWC